jgi:hypothetical protein
MTKILAPNADYNGESAGIKFENGVGETDNPDLIAWFLENGYAVAEAGKPEVAEAGKPAKNKK